MVFSSSVLFRQNNYSLVLLYNGIYIVANRTNSTVELDEAILHETAHYGGKQHHKSQWKKAYTSFWFSLGGIAGLKKIVRKAGFAKELGRYDDSANKLYNAKEMAAKDRSVYLIDEFLALAQGQKAHRKLPSKIKQAILESNWIYKGIGCLGYSSCL
ncbi:MAG: hypothetical protein JAZ19_08705 [Candidatus Thiodiazotropha taylori]|nr:hypothetical protein [Candidatus Thiodiazotropha taylori]